MVEIEPESLIRKLIESIKLVVFDFDGVFTDNAVFVFSDGSEAVRCSRSDGIGLRKLENLGIETIIISSETNPIVARRAEKLQIRCVHGVENKKDELTRITAEHGIDFSETAYVGNDINDLECLLIVGLPIAVKDAYKEVIEVAMYKTTLPGGHGAVREVCDLFEEIHASFL